MPKFRRAACWRSAPRSRPAPRSLTTNPGRRICKQLTGWNVNNAGQGGYQADQIVLLAEQLLPLIRPQVIVVDLIPGTIIGTGYASSGWPKPYFTVENGELVDPQFSCSAKRSGQLAIVVGIKWYLGHFAVLDQFMATFFAEFLVHRRRQQLCHRRDG